MKKKKPVRKTQIIQIKGHVAGRDVKFSLCIVPAKEYPTVAKAFDIMGGRVDTRNTLGMTAAIGDEMLFVIVPHDVKDGTLAHEAVHVAMRCGHDSDQEEAFATAVGTIASDMIESVTQHR